MCMPCVPGGSCETLRSTRTPPADGSNVAVPILSPDAFTMSAWAVDAICTDDRNATVVPWPCALACPDHPTPKSTTVQTKADRKRPGQILYFHWLTGAPPRRTPLVEVGRISYRCET